MNESICRHKGGDFSENTKKYTKKIWDYRRGECED